MAMSPYIQADYSAWHGYTSINLWWYINIILPEIHMTFLNKSFENQKRHESYNGT